MSSPTIILATGEYNVSAQVVLRNLGVVGITLMGVSSNDTTIVLHPETQFDASSFLLFDVTDVALAVVCVYSFCLVYLANTVANGMYMRVSVCIVCMSVACMHNSVERSGPLWEISRSGTMFADFLNFSVDVDSTVVVGSGLSLSHSYYKTTMRTGITNK